MLVLVLVALGAALGACRGSANAIAELATADGPVERQEGAAPWKRAQLGTQFFLGDAARVSNGRATLRIVGGTAQIVMRDGTVLRFGGKPGQIAIAVEAGAIGLSGNGSYSLDVGTVKLAGGTVEITRKGNGRSTVELTVGKGQVETDGQTVDLAIGQPRDVGAEARVAIDAGVRDAAIPIDAAVDAPDDAPAPAAVGDATIEVTGKRAELRAPGQTAWKPLPAGGGPIARGSAVRLGPGTTARLTGGGAVLDLASGARVKLGDGDELELSLEAGGAQVIATNPTALALPGGALALAGATGAAAEARLDATPARHQGQRAARRLEADRRAAAPSSR